MNITVFWQKPLMWWNWQSMSRNNAGGTRCLAKTALDPPLRSTPLWHSWPLEEWAAGQSLCEHRCRSKHGVVCNQTADSCVSVRCAGYLFQKVGKLAASAVGGGFFLLQVNPVKPRAYHNWYVESVCYLWSPLHFQIAHHTGYIKIDWKRVEQDVNKAKKQLKLSSDKPPKEVRTKFNEVRKYFELCVLISVLKSQV